MLSMCDRAYGKMRLAPEVGADKNRSQVNRSSNKTVWDSNLRSVPWLRSCTPVTIVAGVLLSMARLWRRRSSSTTSPPIPKPGTPAGAYIITVSGPYSTGTMTLTKGTQITLTVQ